MRQAQVGLDLPVALGKKLVRLLVQDGWEDDDLIAAPPVHRRGDLCAVGELQRIDHAQDLVEVAARRCRVGKGESQHAARVDYEDRSDRRRTVRFGMKHVVELRHLPVRIGNQGEVQGRALGLFYVPGPAAVRIDRVDAQADGLDVALVELWLEPGYHAELCRADGREVGRVRKENSPAIALPIAEMDGALGRFLGEVRSFVAEP